VLADWLTQAGISLSIPARLSQRTVLARPPPRRRPRSRAALLLRPWHDRSPGVCAFR